MSDNDVGYWRRRTHRLQQVANHSRANRHAAEVAQRDMITMHGEIQYWRQRAQDAESYISRTHDPRTFVTDDEYLTPDEFLPPDEIMPAIPPMPFLLPGQEPQPVEPLRLVAHTVVHDNTVQNDVEEEFGGDAQAFIGAGPDAFFQSINDHIREQLVAGRRIDAVRITVTRQALPPDFLVGGPAPAAGPPGEAANNEPGDNDPDGDNGLPPLHIPHRRCCSKQQHCYFGFRWKDTYAGESADEYELQTAAGQKISIVRDSDDEACPICLEKYVEGDNILPLLCEKKHRFHATCIEKWHEESDLTCPMCRQKFVWSLAVEEDRLRRVIVAGQGGEGDE
jgi:hypothetical protein